MKWSAGISACDFRDFSEIRSSDWMQSEFPRRATSPLRTRSLRVVCSPAEGERNPQRRPRRTRSSRRRVRQRRQVEAAAPATTAQRKQPRLPDRRKRARPLLRLPNLRARPAWNEPKRPGTTTATWACAGIACFHHGKINKERIFKLVYRLNPTKLICKIIFIFSL